MAANKQSGTHQEDAVEDSVRNPSASVAEMLVSLATSAAELADMTSHLRQLTASLAHELDDRRTASRPSPPISAGQLSGVFLAEEGLSDELVRHSGCWRRLSRQVWRLSGVVHPHVWHKLRRRQAATGAAICALVRALEAAVAILVALTACREYTEPDVEHFEKLLRLVSALHAAKSVVVSVSRRTPLPALPGMRLHYHIVSQHQSGPITSLDVLCEQLALARCSRLAFALYSRLTASAELATMLEQYPHQRQQSPASSAAAAPTLGHCSDRSPTLRLPPIVPSIRVQHSTPSSGYDSGGGGEPALETLLGREENAAHSLLLAVPAVARKLIPADQLRPANDQTGKQERLSSECRRRFITLYRTSIWSAACQLVADSLLWRGTSEQRLPGGGSTSSLPPLSTISTAVALDWLQQALDHCAGDLSELGVSGAGVGARVRLCLTAARAAGLLAPALRHSQSSRHTVVQLAAGEQGTRCGELYWHAVSALVQQLHVTLADQAAALACTDVERADLVPLLHLQLCLQQLLRTALHQLNTWVTSRGPTLLSQWQTTTYFLITMADLPRCTHSVELLQPGAPLDAVSPMFAELEVLSTERTDSNRRLDSATLTLQRTQASSLSSVSGACRSAALTSLAALFPGPQYWRRPFITTSQPSDYVRPFIVAVLDEVLEVASRLDDSLQLNVATLVVKVSCNAWMEHILRTKLRFSYAGARQLGRDASALRDWLRHQRRLTQLVRDQLLALDELRELEGAARLLQRQPRQPRANQISPATDAVPVAQVTADAALVSGGSGGSGGSGQLVPCELLVRRPEAWLQLRQQREDSVAALARRWLVCRCCMWPN